jgi:hypothetical protein
MGLINVFFGFSPKLGITTLSIERIVKERLLAIFFQIG